MAEYKDVAAIKTKIQKICDNCWHPYRLGGCPEHCGINDAVKSIDSAPTVDAVPVVRCKDCKHYEWTANRVPEEQTWWCYKHNTEMGNNDYCSYGERKGR